MAPDPPSQSVDPKLLWAADQALLAWIRTGLAMMGFGFVVARFGWFLREVAVVTRELIPPAPGFSLYIGTGLVVGGVLVCILSARQHYAILRALHRGEEYRPPLWSLGILLAVFLAALGLAMAAYLLAAELAPDPAGGLRPLPGK